MYYNRTPMKIGPQGDLSPAALLLRIRHRFSTVPGAPTLPAIKRLLKELGRWDKTVKTNKAGRKRLSKAVLDLHRYVNSHIL